MYPRFVILGAQGAGKGTQAGLLSRHFHIPHISAGDLLRDEVATKSPLGRQIKRIIDRGEMVPDRLMSRLIKNRLSRRDAKKGWIVDGYPRYVAQAKTFDKFARPNVVILLELTDHAAVRRLSGRRVCPHGHIYHIRHSRPRRRGRCNHDGLPLKQRDDDTPTAIRRRLRLYHKVTEPLIEAYRHRGLVVTVDAHPVIHSVYRSLLARINRVWRPLPANKTSRR